MRDRSLDPRELRRRLGGIFVEGVRRLESARDTLESLIVVDQLNQLARFWLDLREIEDLDGQVTRRLEGLSDMLDYLEIRPEWADEERRELERRDEEEGR